MSALSTPRAQAFGSGAGQNIVSSVARGAFSLLSPAGSAGRLSVLLFHKVPEQADPLLASDLALDRFEQILDFLAANTKVLPLAEATAALQRGSLPSRAVALTFDDGYAEWLDHVAPALRRRNLPATFFVTTGQLNGDALWHERIMAAVRALPDRDVKLPAGLEAYADLSVHDKRADLVQRLQEGLKYLPLDRRLEAITTIEAQACRPILLPKAFDIDAVRALHSQGFDIGAHTVHHPILNECTLEQARTEIGGSKEELEAIIRAPVTAFAYPNGRPGEDYRAEHVALVKSCGYQLAVTTSGGAANAGSDVFQLPRFSPWALDENRLAFQLARNMTSAGRKAPAAEVREEVRCLMIASTFPPIHGGSAVVYDNLCRHMPEGSIRVLSARLSYHDGKEIENWREHDAQAPFPIDRIALLRPRIAPPPANLMVTGWRLLCQDLPLYLRCLAAAASIVRRHRINVICVGELVSGSWLGIALKKLFGCKLITYVHGEEITTATGGRLYGNKRTDYLLAADRVVAVSGFTRDTLIHMAGVPAAAVVLIQNGVDTERFQPGPPDPALIARHGLLGKKIVLTVGRLVERKGIDMTVRAMAKVMAQRQDVHYLVVGDGELREQLQDMVKELGLEKDVTLVGKVSDDELLAYLRTCDLFVMPNRTLANGDTEGFGLVFREANACHKPVIGGRAGGAVEAVLDGETGLLVDGYNVDEIADAIERLLSDPVLAQRLADNGLRVARENSTAQVGRRFVDACRELLRR
jgi:phosphatidylinositol alpha-1,6-mannosyltransferase